MAFDGISKIAVHVYMTLEKKMKQLVAHAK